MSQLHVLLVGPMDGGACNEYRFGMHKDALAAQGVELRSLTAYRLAAPTRVAHSVEAAMANEDVVVDRTQIDWADVIVFRRFYTSHWTCLECAFVSPDKGEAERHHRGVAHTVREPEWLIRPLFTALERYPELLRGRAVVYESDDDLLNVQAWNGLRFRIAPERGVIERMVRRADLVTVSTPVLAERHRPFNEAVRVVRNAIDPSWYANAAEAPALEGDPRILYYGTSARMRDYQVCRPAVDEVARAFPDARRVWIGALGAPAGGSPQPVLAAMDEVGSYVSGARPFAAALAAARPDIGLAPLVGDTFDQAKSELHWLEYTMAGAATVATRIPGGGPFDPIRDGIDGMLVDDMNGWRRALTSLAGSRTLREEIAGRARERVLAEYTVTARAADWADAYHWAAAHAGRSVGGRVHALGELTLAEIEPQAEASLAHRRRQRGLAATAADRLDQARAGRVACWDEADGVDPLVSVVVPVLDEPAPVVARAVRSALGGDHGRIEVVVVRDAAGDSLDLEGDLLDPRVRVLTVPPDAALPAGEAAARSAHGGWLLRAGLSAARGAWIAPLSPEAEFEPDHVSALLGIAVEHQLEFVYGRAVIEAGAAGRIVLGSWPPTPDDVLTTGTELFAAGLLAVAAIDPEAWREGATSAWALWHAFVDAGVRMAGIEYDVTRLVPDGATAGTDLDAAEPADAVTNSSRPMAATVAPRAGAARPKAGGRSGKSGHGRHRRTRGGR